MSMALWSATRSAPNESRSIGTGTPAGAVAHVESVPCRRVDLCWGTGSLRPDPQHRLFLPHSRSNRFLLARRSRAAGAFPHRDATLVTHSPDQNNLSHFIGQHAIPATGYRADTARFNFFCASIQQSLGTARGYPVLGHGLELRTNSQPRLRRSLPQCRIPPFLLLMANIFLTRARPSGRRLGFLFFSTSLTPPPSLIHSQRLALTLLLFHS